ncbi:MAG: hypothetical protein Q4C70_10645, partial [Planctomycetia bacterium]|nr:hypothetical protein [Planctomycetia bacterium]
MPGKTVAVAEKSVLPKIDRQALVGRHAITGTEVDLEIPLGNGEFCFNADLTGLQTTRGNVMSHWGWHSFPLPEGFTAADVPPTGTFQTGRNTKSGDISYPPEKQALRQWMFDNPHRANLARIRLVRGNAQNGNTQNADGGAIHADEIQNVRRHMDLWTGAHVSEFTLDGESVRVETFVALDSDTVAARVTSKLLTEGKLAVSVDFPYSGIKTSVPYCGTFGPDDRHTTTVLPGNSSHSAEILHEADDLRYTVILDCSENATLQLNPTCHEAKIVADSAQCVFYCTFLNGEWNGE